MSFQPDRRRAIGSAAGVLLASLSIPRSGAEPTAALDPLVVEAGSLNEVERQRLNSPVPSAGLDQAQLEEYPALQLGDVLKYAPGVYLSGNINENDDLQLRGMPKGYSRTKIDGLMIPDAGGEAREFRLNRLPTGLFKEAKIIRNPTAEYESDGIAGSLEMQTIGIPRRFSNEMRLGFGALDGSTPLWDASVMSGGPVNSWFSLLGAGSFGYDPTMKDKYTTDFLDDGSVDKTSRRHEDTPVETYSAFFDAQLTYEGGELHIKPLYLRRNTEKRSNKYTQEPAEAPDEDQSIDKDVENSTETTAGGTLTSLHRWSDIARQDTVIGFYQSTDRIPDSDTDSYKEDGGVFVYDGSTREDYKTDDQTFDFQTKTTLDLAGPMKQQIKFGAAARNRQRDSSHHLFEIDDSGAVDDLTEDADRYDITENYFAGFLQDQVWLTDQFSLLPGLRLEYQRQHSRDGGSLDSTRSITDLNPTLHALYQPNKELSFHFGFSRTVNRPQFDQLSPFRIVNDDDEEIVMGNPDLDPARSWNFDLGADWGTGPFFLGANLFYKRISDVIQEDIVGTQSVGGDDYDVYQARNVGDGWLKGVELDERFSFSKAGIAPLAGLELWSNQSVYSSKIDFNNGSSGSFEEQPEFLMNIGVDYEVPVTRTLLSAYGNFVGSFDWDESDGTNIGYRPEWIFNLSVRQPIVEGLEAFVEVVNLLDEERFEREMNTDGEYRHERINSGRMFLAGLNYQF